MESRPRLVEAEIKYLAQALKEREEALNALYEVQVRNAVIAVDTVDEERTWSGAELWREVVFHNYEIHGKQALTFFRQGYTWRAEALDKELDKHETVLEGLNREITITRGLRVRFEKVLAGKKKGRLDVTAIMARASLRNAEAKSEPPAPASPSQIDVKVEGEDALDGSQT